MLISQKMVLQHVFSECQGTWMTCKKVDLYTREERDGDIPLISLKIKKHFLFTSSHYLHRCVHNMCLIPE